MEHVDSGLRHGRAAALQAGARHRGAQAAHGTHSQTTQEILKHVTKTEAPAPNRLPPPLTLYLHPIVHTPAICKL